jgi:hypothetical protein
MLISSSDAKFNVFTYRPIDWFNNFILKLKTFGVDFLLFFVSDKITF